MLELDKQAAFNAAYVGVIKQGKPSYKYGSGLKTGGVFEIAPGCRCSLGHIAHDLYGVRWFFNDELEVVCMEEPNAATLSVPTLLMADPFGEQLMKAHDSAAKFTGENNNLGFIAAFQTRMQAIALEHGLTVPEVA